MDEKILAEWKKYPEKKIVIFGAGAGGRVVLQECVKHDVRVSYFVDNGKKGEYFENIEVKDPYDLMYEEEKSLLILVSACRKSLCREISEQLSGMGFVAEKDFFIPQIGRNYAPLDLFDPVLGYGRKSVEEEGFFITEGITANAGKILVFGGSTSDPTFGNITSWVELFAEKLRMKGYDYKVYNGAVAGYCVNQELLKFLRDGLSLLPDIVITMDGFNDATQPRKEEYPFYHPYQADSLEKMFENIHRDSLDINGDIRGMTLGRKDMSERCTFYLRTLKAFHGAAEANNIKHIAFLQPNSSLEKASDFPVLDTVKDFYDKVLTEKPSFMTDASRILEDVSDAYMDYAHYSRKGNEVISEYVLKSVEKFLQKREDKK